MSPEQVIDTIKNSLHGAGAVCALFLSGSYASGFQDDLSDLDFVLVTHDGATDAVAALWKKAIVGVGPLVLWRDRQVRPSLINAITESWLRIDAVILRPDQLALQSRDKLRVLFDKEDLYEGMQDHSDTMACKKRRVIYQFEEFLRILGLLSVAIGRQDYINGVTGVFHLRNLLIELMIEETGTPHRGGALHLDRLLTPEQKVAITSLPVPEPTRDAVIQAHLSYAQAYLPRARQLAEEWGLAWPEQFEAATRARLRDTLSIDVPASNQ